MQRFKNILVFLDGAKGEKDAIEQAAKMAILIFPHDTGHRVKNRGIPPA